ncbi:phosphotransferase [Rhodobacterales bacterium HKCCE3408]|nr:phosphotransferase [Rhodobacterales bacterium HKCCE3408]
MRQDLDTRVITAWMAAQISQFRGPVHAQKFEDGQSNPTFLLSARSGNYVLRRKPPGKLLKSAHAIEREYRVQKALEHTNVPVPKMIALCENDALIGSSFYLMEFVRGRVFDDPSLPGLDKAQRTQVIDEMCKTLAAIHSVDLDATGLSDYGPRGDYFARQIDRWSEQYYASETGTLAEMDELISELKRVKPADDGQVVLVHGDYRLDNMIFDRDTLKCLAVIDWELSTLGHPMADVAAVIMQWQMPPGPAGRGLRGVDRWTLGIPSDEEFVFRYCARRKIELPRHFGFYVAFAFFRMGAILQGVKKRALDGNASNPKRALELGEMVPDFARQGLKALADG